MKFFSRRIIKPEDLNPAQNLFGGTLLYWIDEEASIFATCQLKTNKMVTRLITDINFISSARAGDIIEFGFETTKFGTTSISMCCEVRNKFTQQTILKIDKIVFVCIDENGKPMPHGQGVEPALLIAS
ncbi:MAG: acyl-CoA thioesterase [Gammaproteobacteria bacterium]|nr:acyl-CoA thioesterase [Gammaproteobacteria bacterium]